MLSNLFNRAVYDIMYENIVELGSQQMTIWCLRVAYSIPESTNTNSVCVILIACPLQNCYTKEL